MEAVEVYSGGEDSDFELDENSLRELYKADSVSDKSTTSSIKDELRTKIQQRRISEGQEELKIEFEPPKSYEVPIVRVSLASACQRMLIRAWKRLVSLSSLLQSAQFFPNILSQTVFILFKKCTENVYSCMLLLMSTSHACFINQNKLFLNFPGWQKYSCPFFNF